MAARPLPGARATLFNRRLVRRTLDGETTLQKVATPAALGRLLDEVFGIAVSAEELATAWEVSGRSTTDPSVFC